MAIAGQWAMGMLDKIRSIWWRFPKREEPFSDTARFILSPESADTSPASGTDAAAYPKTRRYPRYSVQGRDIRAHVLFADEVELLNLSIGGACIRTRQDLRLGGAYLLKIRDDRMSRSLSCKVMWKRDVSDADSLHKELMAGLQFRDIASDELVSIKDFMRNSGTPVEKRISDDFGPSPLRFVVTANEKAVLKSPRVLNVKTISLGGMLIECDASPELEGRYHMKLPLPQEAEPIKFSGRIASIIPRPYRGDAPLVDIGVEFLAMEDIDRSRLDSFIRSL
jgi:hypothetical protein